MAFIGTAILIAGIVGLGLGILQNSGSLRDVWSECTYEGNGASCSSRDFMRNNAAAVGLFLFLQWGIFWGPILSAVGAVMLYDEPKKAKVVTPS